jgi:hypothetical protein
VIHTGCRRWLAFAAVLSFGACDMARSPLEPGGTNGGRTLQLEGPAGVAPGQNASFRAVMVSSGGAREDVTERAKWEIGDTRFATVAGAGVVTGRERGETDLIATYSAAYLIRRVLVLEDGTYRIAGRVHDGPRPVANATVSVSRGTGSGLVTTTRMGGDFALYGVAGDIELTVTRDDFQPTIRAQTVTSHFGADIVVTLTPLRAPYQMAGSWTLTITPSSACTALPVDWPRNYGASVTQSGAEITMTLPTDVCVGGCMATLRGHVSHRLVTIDLPFDPVDGAWLQERLPSGALVTIAGTATGNESNDVIEGQLSGDIVYYAPGSPTNPSKCTRNDHIFRLSRR